MKKLLIGTLLVAAMVGAVVVTQFVVAMNRSFEFAQEQARIGRAYMDGMEDADFREVAAFAHKLMSEPEPEWNWHSMSKHDDQPVPEPWRERGVIFVRYRPDWVSIGWHGGPHAHTHLDVDRADDGSFTFTARYTDHEPAKVLRTKFQAQQGGDGDA
ncbi:hypothetical protein HAHE_14170 [Haloferula helveola]|uniref:Uncharacterized protein n=1 Tax=Haloferula helveola TaxID=490095 RepID=A0ABN6H1K1_9BACT|nr:hypothetical protein HAHE_14170 [Haloferula helveola]